jgi:hypothetical protein
MEGDYDGEGEGVMPDVDHTPAGGSPPRPVPKFDDLVEVVQLPYGHHPKLKIGQRGRVVSIKEATFLVRFSWGMEWFTAVQIDRK